MISLLSSCDNKLLPKIDVPLKSCNKTIKILFCSFAKNLKEIFYCKRKSRLFLEGGNYMKRYMFYKLSIEGNKIGIARNKNQFGLDQEEPIK